MTPAVQLLSDDANPGSFESAARAELLRNHDEFTDTLSTALAFEQKGDLLSAAVYASLAAQVCCVRHPGYFASMRLESLLHRIGMQIPDDSTYVRPEGPANPLKNVLHVCSHMVAVGGHTKMLCRWIAADAGRIHSIVLTQQQGPVPENVAQAVHAAGGGITRLNNRPGTILTYAKQLLALAQKADIVVLHIGNQDVIPLIAFARPERRPPVAFLNHCDHMFWIGTTISDVVINLREAARDISGNRRYVESRRNVVVPTLVEPTIRHDDQQTAKRKLGFSPDDVIILSAARSIKYRSVRGRSFADSHVALLKAHPQCKLVVIGSGRPADWENAIAEVGGRILPFAETPDPRPYFEAADIYVDSYPFVSSTSMMEAAGYGLPLVTRFEAPPQANIMAINHPGLIKPSFHTASERAYLEALSRLVTDPELRKRSGAIAKAEVALLHEPEGWIPANDAAFRVAATLPPIDASALFSAPPADKPSFGDPDIRINEVFGESYPHEKLLAGMSGQLPLVERLRAWNLLRRTKTFHSRRHMAGLALPSWLVRALETTIRLY